MKQPKLKCIACGRRATVVLHGTSYCQACAYKGLNKPSIPAVGTSPLEAEARRLGHKNTLTAKVDRSAFEGMFSNVRVNPQYPRFKSGKKLKSQQQREASRKRNARRRALRKRRARNKVRSSSS